MEVVNMEEDLSTKINLLKDVLVEFSHFELENGRAIQDCVEKFKVPRQWILNVTLSPTVAASCAGTDLTFLTDPAKRHCSHSWISHHHRTKFYQQCLSAFDINTVRKKAIYATRNLENIASTLKTEIVDKGAYKVGGGSTMIAGGILGGIGLLLSASTGPVGLTLVGVGAILGFSGSITTSLFGKHSSFSIQEAQLQMTQLKDIHIAISNLLVLYADASKSSVKFENKFKKKSMKVMARVEENFRVLNAGSPNGIEDLREGFIAFATLNHFTLEKFIFSPIFETMLPFNKPILYVLMRFLRVQSYT